MVVRGRILMFVEIMRAIELRYEISLGLVGSEMCIRDRCYYGEGEIVTELSHLQYCPRDKAPFSIGYPPLYRFHHVYELKMKIANLPLD